jgi:2-(3-amino-3-carboxypropyl)histidine synthase
MEYYDLEIARIITEIKKLKKAKPLVLLQFPDGLKIQATKVVDIIEEKTNATCIIWMGSCFGACDTPVLGKLEKKIDLLVTFGHSEWKK